MILSQTDELLSVSESRAIEVVLRLLLKLPNNHPFMGVRGDALQGIPRHKLITRLGIYYNIEADKVEELLLNTGAI